MVSEANQQWLADNALKVMDSVVDAIVTIDARRHHPVG